MSKNIDDVAIDGYVAMQVCVCVCECVLINVYIAI